MKTSDVRSIDQGQELPHDTLALVAGRVIPLYDDGAGNKRRPSPPPEQPHGGADQDYGASNDRLRFGAGPWDYGYGSPTGPWPVPGPCNKCNSA